MTTIGVTPYGKTANVICERYMPVVLINKNEARLLRKLMSQTGMSEKELREHKKYRKMLSEEQKKKGKGKTPREMIETFVMKQVTRELKLAKEHPKTKELYRKRLNEYIAQHPLSKYILQP